MTAILWHIRDLRLHDNPALIEAIASYNNVLPIYILDERAGAASCVWLHHSLAQLQQAYKQRGAKLHLFTGKTDRILKRLQKELDAKALLCNATFEPWHEALLPSLEKTFDELLMCNGNYLMHPEAIRTGKNAPYSVFTPFKNAFKKRYTPSKPLAAPRTIPCITHQSDPLETLKLLPQKNWHTTIEKQWTIGREGALKQLRRFVQSELTHYAHDRDLPARNATSRLSPHLHFGEISPNEVWAKTEQCTAFVDELIWREFAAYLLYYYPNFPTENWKAQFDHFPWKKNPSLLQKWKRGKTGYPIVDAGMRQLWQTGWMHNRVRMIVASFLIKDLNIHWKEGAAWFSDTLVDADIASNSLGWQWVAGSGPDAAPFFRIFNPTLQGEKFDPEGAYITTYCPELRGLTKKWLHKPWLAPPELLKKAGITLGETYPLPIVDHKAAREEALCGFKQVSS